MAFLTMAWAVQRRGISPSAFRVLMALADAENTETRQCNPSQGHLSKVCEMSERSVRRQLIELEERGLLTRSEVRGQRGEVIGTDYHLSLHFQLPDNLAGSVDNGDQLPLLPDKSGTPYRTLVSGNNEPGIEPINPPSSPYAEIGYRDAAPMYRSSHVTRVPDAPEGLPGWQGDPAVRAKAVALEGDAWVRSYLDPSDVMPDGTIVARTSIALTKLRGCLALHGLAVISIAEVSRVQAFARAPSAPLAGGP